MGPIFGAALGSGIGTLVNGGSIGDALKSGLMSGAAGGIFAGFTGAGSFTENVRGAFGDVGGRFSQFGDSIMAGNFGGGDYVSGVPLTPAQAAEAATGAPTAQMAGGDVRFGGADTTTASGNFAGQGTPPIQGATPPIQGVATSPIPKLKPPQGLSIPTGEGLLQNSVADAGINVPFSTGGLQNLSKIPENVPFSDQLRGYVDKTKDFFFPSGPSQEILREGYKNHVAELGVTATEQGFADYVKKQGPSLLRKYGPLAGAGLAVMGAAGGFDTPDGEISPLSGIRLNPDGTPMSARDIMAADPERFRIYAGRNLDPNTGLYVNPAKGQSSPSMIQDAYAKAIEQYPGGTLPLVNLPPVVGYGRPYVSPEFNPVGPTPTGEEVDAFLARQQNMGMADGGHVFPRRNGGISPDEGIAGKDSVKAMLMPGEFVMTTKAVRGLGNGNLNNGIKNMYSVMRNLEKRGRAA